MLAHYVFYDSSRVHKYIDYIKDDLHGVWEELYEDGTIKKRSTAPIDGCYQRRGRSPPCGIKGPIYLHKSHG